jgi:hypothetical protein
LVELDIEPDVEPEDMEPDIEPVAFAPFFFLLFIFM